MSLMTTASAGSFTNASLSRAAGSGNIPELRLVSPVGEQRLGLAARHHDVAAGVDLPPWCRRNRAVAVPHALILAEPLSRGRARGLLRFERVLRGAVQALFELPAAPGCRRMRGSASRRAIISSSAPMSARTSVFSRASESPSRAIPRSSRSHRGATGIRL
jgi:hypothetical protein